VSCAVVANGSVTPLTPSISVRSASAVLIAACCSPVNASSPPVWNTTVPEPPLAAANSSCRCSVTFSVSVPGMVTADVRVPPNAKYAPTDRASTSAQAVTTAQARRAEKRPIR